MNPLTDDLGPLPSGDRQDSLEQLSLQAIRSRLTEDKFRFRRETEDEKGIDGTLEVNCGGKMMIRGEDFSRRELNEQIASLVPERRAWGATVPIIAIRGKSLQQFGTGTLFRVADESFVVTAAHVIEIAASQKISLCVGGAEGRFVPMEGQSLCTDTTTFDVAVVRLAPEIASQLCQKEFLRLGDVSLDVEQSTGVFCVFGYPTLWCAPSDRDDDALTLRPFQFTTYGYEGETTGFESYLAHFHLLLSAKLDDTTDPEGLPAEFRYRTGTPAPFPRELGGISGCSVWKIGDRSRPIDQWKHEKPKIVAVETAVFSRSQCVKATRWRAVFSIIYDAFPELRAALQMWRGK